MKYNLHLFPGPAGLTAASIGVTEGSAGTIATATVTGTLPSGSSASRLSQAILNVYSKEILFQAQPRLVFDQFANCSYRTRRTAWSYDHYDPLQ